MSPGWVSDRVSGLLSMSNKSVADVAVLLGPVSEFVGRKKVLHYSFACFFRKSLTGLPDPSRRLLILSAQLSRRFWYVRPSPVTHP